MLLARLFTFPRTGPFRTHLLIFESCVPATFSVSGGTFFQSLSRLSIQSGGLVICIRRTLTVCPGRRDNCPAITFSFRLRRS